jgi:hypothetical protein
MHGLELLKNGMIWSFMSGSKIKFWRHNGLPRESMKVIGKAAQSRKKWVFDLIDPATKISERSWLREFSSQLMRM